MSNESKKLTKLNRVLGFYEQRLEGFKSQLGKQLKVVAGIQARINQLNLAMVETQRLFDQQSVSVSGLQMVNRKLDSLETKVKASTAELVEANKKLDVCREDVRQQMSKMDSLEKIVVRTSSGMEQHLRKQEQHQADERYLNTHFSG